MYIKKILIFIAFAGILGCGLFANYVYNAVFTPNTKFETQTHTLTIPSTATYNDIMMQLKPLLKDINSFHQIAKRKGYLKYVKPGRFILKKGMNNNDIVNTLRSKNRPISLVFNNQERLEDLAGRISTQIEADSISLIKAFRSESFLVKNSFTIENAIAMYIPNKYEFFWNTSAIQFRDRMLKEYHSFWTSKRLEKAKKVGLSPLDVSVIASIVHKETVKVDERPRVAGVYINRLNDRWKLEADPTVIFAVKKQTKRWDTIIKRVLYKDLEIDSPFNTYKYAGIPPGPISMPDISAIDAVLNYERHSYYFFVADVSNMGYHKFARTLAQHNRNRKLYVNWVNNQGIRR